MKISTIKHSREYLRLLEVSTLMAIEAKKSKNTNAQKTPGRRKRKKITLLLVHENAWK
jgi:hypothetical protein